MVRTAASRAGPQVPGAWRALAELGNGAAIAQGLRTALVCFASFAIGQWALGQLEIAVFATFTGLALCGIADFGGTLTGRFLACPPTADRAPAARDRAAAGRPAAAGASCRSQQPDRSRSRSTAGRRWHPDGSRCRRGTPSRADTRGAS